MNGYEALRTGAAWIDLSARGKIRVTGEDRARLLHAMCTNHIQGLAEGRGLYAFFLNEKGRILADAYIYNLGDSLFLDTEPEIRQKLFDHLDRFIIADDVTLEDKSESLAAIGLEGPTSLSLARQFQIPVGGAELDVLTYGKGLTVRVSATGVEAVRIFVPEAEKRDLVDRLQRAGAIAATAEQARVVRIENGIPRYGEDISDRFLVHETQLLHAVHTNKGCYLGQEIVERVRSRGQVHRHLMPFHARSSTVPTAGSKVTLKGVDVAEITSAVYSPERGDVVGLAYLRGEPASAGGEMILAGSDPPVIVSFT
jgi:aminomethyltransferase